MATPIIPTGIDAQESCSKFYFNKELTDFIDNPHVNAGIEYSVTADGKTIDMEWTSKLWENPFCAIFAHPFEFAYCDVWTFKGRYSLFMDGDTPKYKAETCSDMSGDMICTPYRDGSGDIDGHMIGETGLFLLAMVKSGEGEETVEPIKAFLRGVLDLLVVASPTDEEAPSRTGLSFISDPLTLIDPIWASVEKGQRSFFLAATVSAVRSSSSEIYGADATRWPQEVLNTLTKIEKADGLREAFSTFQNLRLYEETLPVFNASMKTLGLKLPD